MCKGEAPFLASEIKFDTLFYPILLRIGEVSLIYHTQSCHPAHIVILSEAKDLVLDVLSQLQ